MKTTARNVALLASSLVLLSFVVFVVNQTAQVVQLADRAHPIAGQVTLYVLITTYGVLILTPVVMFVRLPRPLVPPQERQGPEYQAHLELLRKRMRVNRHHHVSDLAGPGIERAIQALDEEAARIVKTTATQVFLSTAISQSGRLDTLLVFSMQTRMVWRIAHLYYQRPTVRDLYHLYANVAATSFVAGELQDLDLSEHVEPVFSAVVGSLGGVVPGFQLATSILANSILSGAADAFLTLRVGLIARNYCGALVVEQPAALRRRATTEAAQYLGGIVADGSARITGALWKNSREKVGDAAKDAYSKLSTVFDRIKKRGQAEAPVS
jgi:uncharacterized membrane protein YcjF (UPF0283 family)